jgi:hypothetical protein
MGLGCGSRSRRCVLCTPLKLGRCRWLVYISNKGWLSGEADLRGGATMDYDSEDEEAEVGYFL